VATGQVVVTEANGGTSTSEERRVAVFDPAAPQHSSAGGSGAGGRKKVISGSKHTSAAGEVHLVRDDVTPHQSMDMVGLPVCNGVWMQQHEGVHSSYALFLQAVQPRSSG
jgi:hypothetical protein